MAQIQSLPKRGPQVRRGESSRPARRQFLAFGLESETFAIEIRYVKEVIQYEPLTDVPLMPPFVRGVINLRGAAVPVLDLSVRFGRPASEVARRTCIVILEVPREGRAATLGVIVDQVNEVLELAQEDIEPAPSFRSELRSEFLSGVGKVGGRFVILLDVHHILSQEELTTLSDREAGAP